MNPLMTDWRSVALLGLLLMTGIVIGMNQPDRAFGQATASAIPCGRSVIYDASTNGSTQLVAGGNGLHICGYSFFAAGTVNVKLIYGTGVNCATNPTNLTPAYRFTTQTGLVDASPYYRGMFVPTQNALCINTSAGQPVQAIVYYQ